MIQAIVLVAQNPKSFEGKPYVMSIETFDSPDNTTVLGEYQDENEALSTLRVEKELKEVGDKETKYTLHHAFVTLTGDIQ